MQKKSTSQSVFVNPRIVGGFSIFLLGVFLALVGVATPSVPSHRFVARTGANPVGPGGTILFDQLTGFTLGDVPAQSFVPPGPFDTEPTDDFQVFDAQGWTIGQFNFEIGLVGSEPAMVDIRVYPDDNGQPGDPALFSYNGLPATLQTRRSIRSSIYGTSYPEKS